MAIEQGPTPNGGVASEVLFSDADGNLVDKEQAAHAEVIEYDASGEVIKRTYATIGAEE
jgi:uncharacterized protein RhaS with RHS repeats